jgi:hypothetical protein
VSHRAIDVRAFVPLPTISPLQISWQLGELDEILSPCGAELPRRKTISRDGLRFSGRFVYYLRMHNSKKKNSGN